MGVDVSWQQDEVAAVTLGWPDRRNAIGPKEALELASALDDVRSARVVLLLAEGPAFCAGGDLDAIGALARQGPEAVRDAIYGAFHAAARALWGLPGISIAAVDGPAVGLGADLALLCNVRLVGTGGWLDQGWARLGLIPGTGGAWLVQSIAGTGTAWDFVTSAGTPWDGPTLERRGLATAVDGSAADAARQRAGRIARWPADTAGAYRSLLGPGAEAYEDHLTRCLDFQTTLLTSEAFLELAERARGRTPARD
jgi:enoyl-CoA hydratase/carnithine racemase